MIEGRWRSSQCRTEDGIYFGDDTYLPVDGLSPSSDRRPTLDLISSNPVGRIELDPIQLCIDGDRVVFGGETNWEGEGYLALANSVTGELVWLMKSQFSEAFTKASIEGNIVRAESNDDTQIFTWTIPIDAPWNLTVREARY